MAGPLTWRNVDAPNFSGVFDGIRTASELLNNASVAGQNGIAQFIKARTDVADKAILNRALGLQDVNAMRAGITDGSVIGPDGQFASAAALQGVDSRVGTLLDRATNMQRQDVVSQALDTARYTDQRLRDANTRGDAAAPAILNAYNLARSGDEVGLTGLLRSDDTIANLPPEQLTTLMKTLDPLAASNQTRQANNIDMTKSQYNFGTQVTNDQDNKTAQAATMQILPRIGSTEDAQLLTSEVLPTLSSGAGAQLISNLRGQGYNVFAPIPGVTGTGGVGIPTPAAAGTNTKTSLPGLSEAAKAAGLPAGLMESVVNTEIGSNSKFIEDPAAYHYPLNAEGKRIAPHTGKVSTAFGPYGILESTAKNPGYGVKPLQNKSLEEQTRFATEYMAARIKAEGLENGVAGYGEGASYANKVLSKAAGTTSVADPAAQKLVAELSTGATKRKIQEEISRSGDTDIVTKYDDLIGAEDNTITEARKLVGKDGVFAGSSLGSIVDRINEIKRYSKGAVSAPVAAAMMRDNVESSDWDITRIGNRVADVFRGRNSSPNLAGGVRVNDDGLFKSIDDYVNRNTSVQAEARLSAKATKELVTSAQTAYNAANQQYELYLSQSKSRPGLQSQVARYKQLRDEAYQKLERVKKLYG